jgi:hypothetical protein
MSYHGRMEGRKDEGRMKEGWRKDEGRMEGRMKAE